MKKVFYAFASLLSLAAFAGCQKDGGDEAEHNASFRLVLMDAVGTSASVAVSSTGTEADTWYCFCTSDLNSSTADLVSSEVAKLGGNASSVLKSGNKSVSFQNLTSDTDYRAVVTGLLSDGSVYGTPVELKFNSGKEFGVIQKNENWKVSYAGRGMYGEKNWTIADFITVEVGGSNSDKFFSTVVPASSVPDQNDSEAMGEFLDQCIEETQAQLDEYGRTWSDVLVDESVDDPYPVLAEGEYYAFAIGADTKGRRSGLWNCSKFKIEPASGSEEFMKYQGVWTYTSAEGTSIDVTFTPIISESEGIGGYLVKGWQKISDFTAVFEIDKQGAPHFYFMGYDTGIEVQLTDGSVGTLGTWGTVSSSNNCYNGGALAELVLDGDSKAVLSGLETDEGNINQFVFGVNIVSGSNTGIALLTENAPTLPCNLTKKASAKAEVAASVTLSSKLRARQVYSYTSLAKSMTFMK